MKRKLLIQSLVLSSIIASTSALEWKDYNPNFRAPVAGKDTGTGVYVRKRNTGFTDTYANFFGGNQSGAYWDGHYWDEAPTYHSGMGLSYNNSFSTLISRLIIRSEGWSTLQASDSRWEGSFYSAATMTGGGELTLHATNRPVGGGSLIDSNNPYVYVKHGDTLIIGNGGKNTGIIFDWKEKGYDNAITADTVAYLDIRGMLLSNIKLQQQGNERSKLVLDMKLSGDGSFKGLVDIGTKTAGNLPNFTQYDMAYKFDDLWNGRNGTNKRDFHRVEFGADHTYDVSGYNAQFLVGDAADTLFYLTDKFRGGRYFEIHAKKKGKALIKTDMKDVTIGTLSADDHGEIRVTHMSRLTIDNLAFGVWDEHIGTISGGVTQRGYIGIESRNTLTINAFRGNTAADGSNPTTVELKDMKGVVYHMKDSMDRVKWTLGVNNGTTLNLYGKKNILNDVYGVSSNKSLTIYTHTNDKTLIGMEKLGVDVLNSGITVRTTVRKNNKTDVFYINSMINPSNGSALTPTGKINLIPTIGSQDDRKRVEGEIVGYTPNHIPGLVKEIYWKPDDGILKNGFKITLGTFENGKHTGWMIDKYILIGVDDVKPPEPPIDPEPEPEPKPPEPPVDPEPPVTPPDPEKPDPDPNPNPGPGGGEGEKPDPTPPDPGPGEGGDNNGGTKPPVTPDPTPPVTPDPVPPLEPDPLPPGGGEDNGNKPGNPGEGGEDKPNPPVTNDSVFTDEFKNTIGARVQGTMNLFLVNFNSINKRLGDLRGNDGEHGVWTRAFAGGYSNVTFWTVQVGYDNQLLRTKNGSFYLGTAASYSKDNLTNMGEVALYASFIQDSGWYNDTIVKFAMMNSKSVVKDFNHYGFVLSDEIGYRFNFNGFFLDPQVELSLGYLTGADFKDVYSPNPNVSSVVNASFSDSLHFRARFGSSLGYNHVFENKGIKLQGYVGVFGEVDKFSKSIGKVGAYGYEEIYGAAYTDDKRLVLNVGTNVDFRDNGRLYVDFERSFLGKFNIDWKVNLGYRYSFGKKDLPVEEETEEEKKEDVTPVKLKEDSKDKKGKDKEGTK